MIRRSRQAICKCGLNRSVRFFESLISDIVFRCGEKMLASALHFSRIGLVRTASQRNWLPHPCGRMPIFTPSLYFSFSSLIHIISTFHRGQQSHSCEWISKVFEREIRRSRCITSTSEHSLAAVCGPRRNVSACICHPGIHPHSQILSRLADHCTTKPLNRPSATIAAKSSGNGRPSKWRARRRPQQPGVHSDGTFAQRQSCGTCTVCTRHFERPTFGQQPHHPSECTTSRSFGFSHC